MRVQKIPVTIADDCPNRRGLKGMQTCVFCDAWGSAAYPELQGEGLKKQIEQKKVLLGERYGASAFLIYFQAYTSTFLGVKALRNYFEDALSFNEVRGLVIGTRPDCLSEAVFNLWSEYSRKTFLSVELGVQSFNDERLEFLRRGHSGKDSLKAIRLIKEKAPEVDLGVHLIFGIPGESDSEIIEAAQILSNLPVDNIKIHNLHVLKNTPLETLYNAKEFIPDTLEEYARKTGLFLSHLAPRIAIHRLAALSSHWEELVAPEWTKYKMKSYQFILDYMKSQDIYQGKHFQRS